MLTRLTGANIHADLRFIQKCLWRLLQIVAACVSVSAIEAKQQISGSLIFFINAYPALSLKVKVWAPVCSLFLFILSICLVFPRCWTSLCARIIPDYKQILSAWTLVYIFCLRLLSLYIWSNLVPCNFPSFAIADLCTSTTKLSLNSTIQLPETNNGKKH